MWASKSHMFHLERNVNDLTLSTVNKTATKGKSKEENLYYMDGPL